MPRYWTVPTKATAMRAFTRPEQGNSARLGAFAAVAALAPEGQRADEAGYPHCEQ